VLAPLAGRMSDRIGRRAPYVLGMAIWRVDGRLRLGDSLPMVIFALLLNLARLRLLLRAGS